MAKSFLLRIGLLRMVPSLARVKLNKALYRRRQEIVEHPFGTIKRQWGYDYTLMKGLEKVDGAFAIIFTTYNLRRAITLLGVKELIEKLRTSIYPIFWHIGAHFKSFSSYIIKINIHQQPEITSLMTLKRAA